jgi:WD40 repeat protein
VSVIDDVLEVISRDPYEGLRLASLLGGNEGSLHGEALQTALVGVVPDEAFTVPETISSLRATHDGQALVETIDGSWWSAASADRGLPLPSVPGLPAPTGAVPGMDLAVMPGTGQVVVRRDGQVLRKILGSGPVDAVALSPDGRSLAVAAGASVDIFDIEIGQHRNSLRGSPATLSALAWSEDSRRLFGATDRQVISWQVRQGVRLMDEPDQQFEAVLASAESDAVWLVVREQGLRLVDVGDGTTRRSISLEGPFYSAVGDEQGSRAVLARLSSLLVIDLVSEQTVELPLGDCAPRTPRLLGDRLYVACLSGPVLELDPATGAELDRIDVEEPGASALGLSESGELFIGGVNGQVWQAQGRRPVEQTTLRCQSEVMHLDVARDATVVSPVGLGSGQLGCTQRGIVDDEGERRWDSFAEHRQTSTVARASRYVPALDALAIGFDDGTVTLRPAHNLEPTYRFDEVHGIIRDLHVLDDGTALIAATRSGALHSLPIGNVPLTNRAAASEAERRLMRARELGLTDVGVSEDDAAVKADRE